ncbi:MAG TPA: anthranilate phosphoribosyltransferase [Bacteroidota bacterium]
MMKYFIEKCLAGEDLTMDEASQSLNDIMEGNVSDAEIAGLLVALRAKGESVSEIAGFASIMRARCTRITLNDDGALDIVGTGGDGLGTFNISTAAMFVAAGAGVTIAKHGNRSVSSKSGSADVLTSLGVNIQLPPREVEECINTIGIGFLFAPLFHPSMKHVAKARKDLGIRSIFNLVGPLTNPAGVKRQVLGTYDSRVAAKLAKAAHGLGDENVTVVTADGGLDEVSISGETTVLRCDKEGNVKQTPITPEDFGFSRQPLSSIKGGGSDENARITFSILKGEKTPHRNVTVANAALGILTAGKAPSLMEAKAMCEGSIDSGQAHSCLNQLIEFSTKKSVPVGLK